MNSALDLRVVGLMLRQGRRLNALSWLLLALAALWLVLDAGMTAEALSWSCIGLLWLGVLAGVVQLYHAMRVDFDAELLLALTDPRAVELPPQALLEQLDRSLLALGLIKPAQAGRDWSLRWAGLRRLLLRQAICVVLQAGCLIAVWIVSVLVPG